MRPAFAGTIPAAVTAAVVALGATLAAGGCGGAHDPELASAESLEHALVSNVLDVLAAPDQLEILSLAHRPIPGVPPERMFHGYAVLGRAPIPDHAQQQEIVAAFYQSAREANEELLCFMPHHGLHAVRGAAVVDIVICFHCMLYQLYDGDTHPFGALSRTAEPLFRRIVHEHQIPIERDWYIEAATLADFRARVGLPPLLPR